MSDDRENPAVQARRLRARLKRAREDADLTQDHVAKVLEWSLSKIVRIESGAVGISTTDLKALLELYKITNARQVEELASMARAARKRPWWSHYREFASQRYLEFVEFEQAADAALHFQPQFVPGLLQTARYASAIIRGLGRDMTEPRAEGLLDFRMRRQRLLDSSEPPTLSFVLNEAVVHRRVGTPEVMRGQIDRLIELAGRPNITIQIFPFAAGLVPRMQTPFVILQFPDSADPDVLYLESPRGDTVVADDEEEVDGYRHSIEQLRQRSLPGPESAVFLKELGTGLGYGR